MSDLRNVGFKTVKENEEVMERIRAGGMPIYKKTKCSTIDFEPKYMFENMSVDLDYLRIEALEVLGLSSKLVARLKKNNIQCCGKLRFLPKRKFEVMLGRRYIDKLSAVAGLLEKDIIALLEYVLNSNCESRYFDVFLRRAKGETLQEIADNPREHEDPITRERVRQLESKYARSIMPFVRELFYILKGSNNYVSIQDILDVYDVDEYDQVLVYACKSFEKFEYLDFAEIIVEKQNDYSLEAKLVLEITDVIGDGADLYENKERLDSILEDNKLDFIEINAIIRLLKKNKYHIFGSFVFKGKSNYANVCMYIVKKEFPDGIKLSQNDSEQSEDLKKLRSIIEERFQDLLVPSSDRALSSALIRSGLILRGRGIYIAQEYVTVDESQLQEIKDYIDKKQTNRVYYSEVFAEYEGVLNALYGIDNYNYLHGILSMYYPKEYEYYKDYFLKNGVSANQTESISDRIYDFIISVGRPVSKIELLQEFRGFSNVMLMIPFTNDKRLMQWDYNYYTCTGIQNITKQDTLEMYNYVVELLQQNGGYTSDALLFEKVKILNSDFLSRNKIKNEMNLYYIISKMFSEDMDFRRPHICKKGMFDILSTKNVVLYLLGNPERFTYDEYNDMCEQVKWARVTASATLPEIEDDYARISIETYVRKDQMLVPDSVVNEIHDVIIGKLANGILPLMDIEFDDFPKLDIEWNEFLIESLIRKYYLDLDVIHPVMKDRRYQKGIVVKKVSGLISYPQVVATVMKSFGYEVMSESQFLSFLVLHSLSRKTIPIELRDSDYIKYDGKNYVLVTI
ncbi:hypothetical protein EII25_05355 [Erysipelotrichaceae bacterium OH741_COT-311]|nr:hypothetical protein EII25_05355 [Erysipelotrichaceae bacterium OH741_COT-311]